MRQLDQAMFRNSENFIIFNRVMRWTFLGILVISLPSVWLFGCSGLGYLASKSFDYLVIESICPRQLRYTVKDPATEFTEYTNLNWPETAVVISVGDDHGGFRRDGEFHLVFDADKETLEGWLASPPSWGNKEWKHGPIPDEFFHQFFVHVKNKAIYQSGLSQPLIRYCAEDLTLSKIPRHYGRLLAIDPIAGRVYLSWWGFR